eukprot:7898832-Alexandrium_andersonii.AAC.1
MRAATAFVPVWSSAEALPAGNMARADETPIPGGAPITALADALATGLCFETSGLLEALCPLVPERDDRGRRR